jgi:hypothetical protein
VAEDVLSFGVEVVPTTVLSDKARPLVEHANVAGSCHVGSTEFDNAGQVVRRAVDDVHNLQPPPPRVAPEIDHDWSRRRVPGGEQPLDIRFAKRLEPRPHQRLGRQRPCSIDHPDIVAITNVSATLKQ